MQKSNVVKMRRCAYCDGFAQGNYSIHRDGFGVGPEVDLCDGCGGQELPTCDEIWMRTSRFSSRNKSPKDPTE